MHFIKTNRVSHALEVHTHSTGSFTLHVLNKCTKTQFSLNLFAPTKGKGKNIARVMETADVALVTEGTKRQTDKEI
jgi:hypothetical protein